MNRYLYKYMPLRENFFKDLMIRATPNSALNDPFEGCFNKNQLRDADKNTRNFYRENGKEVHDIDESELDQSMGVIQDDLSHLGVIAFTEDFNNPLMWAHYADEHRGMVIEFDFNKPFFMDSLKVIDGQETRFGRNYLGEHYEFPERVSYHREMPSFKREELSAPDSMKEPPRMKFKRAILFTKSIDWIYEKEHRSIIPLKDADSIICEDCHEIRNIQKNNSAIQLTNEDNGKIRITYPREYEMHEEMADESIKTKIHLLTHGNSRRQAIHLFRINPLAVTGVYFGCKSNYKKAIDDIAKNSSLKNLNNINKIEIGNEMYQLKPTKLTI